MFGRPRCREWTPLATQQLRLRSLVQIVGYNIRPPEWCTAQCSFYLTMHHTTMSAPFYTSERISSPHPKWKEIDSELTHRMSSTNVVIRIWCHTPHPLREDDNEKYRDTVIQTWGVYFSGLRYIGANLALNFTSDCFKSNTLVFQMQGGYFCSYKSLKLDVIPPENEMDHGSLSSSSSGKTNLSKITLEPKFIQRNKLKEARSISPSKFAKKFDKEYSKSNSPVERSIKQNFSTLKASTSLNINHNRKEESKNNDPNYIYEHSPDNLDIKEFSISTLNCFGISKTSSQEDLAENTIDLSETAENYDLRNESDVPKYRYMSLNFLKSEIRPSYNASKLQKLHLLQYSIKKRQEAVQEIKERIYTKSALESWPQNEQDTKLRFKSKSFKNLFSSEEGDSLAKEKSSQSDLSVKNGKIKEERPTMSKGPRLTLKLNDLLSFKSKPSPFQRSEHIRLTKQLEILRFKRIILSDERDSKLANIRRLKETHAKLLEENQDVGVELMQKYHSLSRRNETMKETRTSCAAMRELAARSHAALQTLRQDLLNHLQDIFYIEQKEPAVWTICGVRLPVCGESDAECPRSAGQAGQAGAGDGAAAGLAAQATVLAAAVLHQPLRYCIALRGSASKITDVTPDLPDPNIPLFARGGDATLFRYAMFLLNKCIAQLLWARGIPFSDMRPTLANLQRLLTTPSNVTDTSKLFGTYKWLADNQCPRTQSLRSLVASERGGKYRQFNRFKDSVDGQSPHSMNLKRHRHSRSVGSYNDDQELANLDTSTTSLMGSESNIYNMKLTEANSELTLNTHNSDSEIQRILDDNIKTHTSDSEIQRILDDKVVFTLGDDTTLTNLNSQTLVRISTNNEDECLDVKRICSEIESFCSTSDHKEIHEGFDVAKHMAMNEAALVKTDCESCEVCPQRDLCEYECANNVTEVIVIQSAEASIDTGQVSEVKESGDQ